MTKGEGGVEGEERERGREERQEEEEEEEAGLYFISAQWMS